MANRKESMRKALGISEYPWSSDDEENQDNMRTGSASSAMPVQEDDINVNDMNLMESRPTGSSSAPPQAVTRRTQSRADRDMYWAIVNNSRGPPCMPMGSSAYDGENRVDLNCPVSNIQRVMAIKKLSQEMKQYTLNRRLNNRNAGNSSRAHSDDPIGDGIPLGVAERMRQRARRRLVANRNHLERFLESGSSSRHDEVPPHEDPDDATENANHADGADQQSEQERSFSPHIEDNHEAPNNVIEANTSRNCVRMEEEIVEIEPESAPNVENVNNDVSMQEDNNEQTTSDGQTSETQRRKIKRKRDVPDDLAEPSSLKEINQKLLRLLECPVCLEWMEPPLSQCGRGHLLCGRCRARLSLCPVCRSTFSAVRNRAMEAVAELVRYPCRHGCGQEKRLRRRTAHEANCPSRLYRCPAPPCSGRAPLPLADLPHHCQTRHLSILRMGRRHKLSVRLNGEQHENWLVTWAQRLFHLRLDVELHRGIVVYVAYIGPMAHAKNFIYEVTVQGQHNERKLVYTRATHSDLECSSLNVTRKDCFHLPFEHALNFLRVKYRACETEKPLELVVMLTQREPQLDADAADPADAPDDADS